MLNSLQLYALFNNNQKEKWDNMSKKQQAAMLSFINSMLERKEQETREISRKKLLYGVAAGALSVYILLRKG